MHQHREAASYRLDLHRPTLADAAERKAAKEAEDNEKVERSRVELQEGGRKLQFRGTRGQRLESAPTYNKNGSRSPIADDASTERKDGPLDRIQRLDGPLSLLQNAT